MLGPPLCKENSDTATASLQCCHGDQAANQKCHAGLAQGLLLLLSKIHSSPILYTERGEKALKVLAQVGKMETEGQSFSEP